jgi:hypothetical protein
MKCDSVHDKIVPHDDGQKKVDSPVSSALCDRRINPAQIARQRANDPFRRDPKHHQQ